MKWSCLPPSQWFIPHFTCVNSIPFCLNSYMETCSKHSTLEGWGLTDEKNYEAVSTKLPCNTCDKRFQIICIWFTNEPLLYGIYKFSFCNRQCPWRATLALGSTSQQISTPSQEIWQALSTVREIWGAGRHFMRMGGGKIKSKVFSPSFPFIAECICLKHYVTLASLAVHISPCCTKYAHAHTHTVTIS